MAIHAVGTTLKMTVDNVETQIGKLKSIGEIKQDSDMIDVSTLDSEDGFKQYAQGMRDAGEVTLRGYLDKEEAAQGKLRQLYLSGKSASFTVTFPDGEKATFSAMVKSVTAGAAEVDGAVEFGAVLRLQGGVTFS